MPLPKNLGKSIAFYLILLFTQISWAQDFASNGFWNNSSTWNSGTTPGNSDHLEVPSGVTVTVNCNCGTYSGMTIDVYGTLNFPGGKKINLTSDGVVNVFPGGQVSGSNNGDKITINGAAVWSGSQPNISGPTTCNGLGCGTNSTLPIELESFDMQLTEKDLILSWVTASETDNAFFTIATSYDFETWDEQGIISGAGSTIYQSNYEFNVSLKDFSGDFYIRLTQTDFDGKEQELVVDYIKNQFYSKPSFYPSLAKDFLYFKQLGGVSQIEINALSGRVWTYNINSTEFILGIENDMQSGLYLVRFLDDFGREVETKKLVVSKN